MDERKDQLEKKLQDLLDHAGEVATQLDRLERKPGEIPHYLQIELAAHQIGRRLSCGIQQSQMAQLTGEQATQVACPKCGTSCSIQSGKRQLQSIDGLLDQVEPKAHCPSCRRDFFPSA